MVKVVYTPQVTDICRCTCIAPCNMWSSEVVQKLVPQSPMQSTIIVCLKNLYLPFTHYAKYHSTLHMHIAKVGGAGVLVRLRHSTAEKAVLYVYGADSAVRVVLTARKNLRTILVSGLLWSHNHFDGSEPHIQEKGLFKKKVCLIKQSNTECLMNE